jgi:Tol biopolymer transport system component
VASGNFRLWKVPLSPGAGSPAGEPLEVAHTGVALARHLTIAPDGKRIAYSALTMTNHLGSVPISPASHEATGPPVLLTQDTSYRKLMQTFSPDGRQTAYSVWRLGNDGEIWVMDADGRNPRPVTTEPAGLLGWLPTGDRIAFIAKHSSGSLLWVADLKSGKQTPLSDSRVEGSLGRLSPDGKQLAFNSRAGGPINVWTAPLEGGPARQLTFDQELMGFPVWSPDGRWLACEMQRGDDTHLTVIPSSGGTPVQLTSDRGQSWPGSWSPDGDKIAFAGLRQGVWNVWWVSRREPTQRRVTNYTRPNIYVRYPAWSPRGDRIVYEYAETAGNIWVMELK